MESLGAYLPHFWSETHILSSLLPFKPAIQLNNLSSSRIKLRKSFGLTKKWKASKRDSSRCLWLTIFASWTAPIWRGYGACSAHYASLPQPTLYPVQNNELQFLLHLNPGNKRHFHAIKRRGEKKKSYMWSIILLRRNGRLYCNQTQ